MCSIYFTKQMHNATGIQMHNATGIQMHNATGIQMYNATGIQILKAYFRHVAVQVYYLQEKELLVLKTKSQ